MIGIHRFGGTHASAWHIFSYLAEPFVLTVSKADQDGSAQLRQPQATAVGHCRRNSLLRLPNRYRQVRTPILQLSAVAVLRRGMLLRGSRLRNLTVRTSAR